MSSDRRDETARRLPSVPRLGVGVLALFSFVEAANRPKAGGPFRAA